MITTSYVFVYGTLKSGFGNHLLLAECPGIRAAAPDIELHDVGPYPFACRGTGTAYGEIYLVTEAVLAVLDRLEGHPNWYRRETTPVINLQPERIIDIPNEAWIYLNDGARRYPLVESGNWERKHRFVH